LIKPPFSNTVRALYGKRAGNKSPLNHPKISQKDDISPRRLRCIFYDKGECYVEIFSKNKVAVPSIAGIFFLRGLQKKKRYFENQKMQKLPEESQHTLEFMSLVQTSEFFI